VKPGPDDHFYTVSRAGVRRYDEDLKPAPFETLKNYQIDTKIYAYGNGNWTTFDVSRDGVITLMDQNSGVRQYDLKGNLIRDKVVTFPKRTLAQIVRVDSRGSIYLGLTLRDPGDILPLELRGRLPWRFGFNAKPRWHYEHLIGSVVKFSAKGGTLRLGKGGKRVLAVNYSGYEPCKAEGVQWVHFGFAPRIYRDTNNANCNCEQANFDIDGFDRIFVPNAPLFRVDVIDRNNNPITSIGRYGNMDALGPRSAHPDPAIGFAWPMNCSVGDKYLYVGDPLNDRITRIRIEYLAEAEVKLTK
jgi:hypothetical protein